ncbi:hypothetical protein D3C81_1932680 [compost metagenome]
MDGIPFKRRLHDVVVRHYCMDGKPLEWQITVPSASHHVLRLTAADVEHSFANCGA